MFPCFLHHSFLFPKSFIFIFTRSPPSASLLSDLPSVLGSVFTLHSGCWGSSSQPPSLWYTKWWICSCYRFLQPISFVLPVVCHLTVLESDTEKECRLTLGTHLGSDPSLFPETTQTSSSPSPSFRSDQIEPNNDHPRERSLLWGSQVILFFRWSAQFSCQSSRMGDEGDVRDTSSSCLANSWSFFLLISCCCKKVLNLIKWSWMRMSLSRNSYSFCLNFSSFLS